MPYRTLDDERVIATIERLHRRIRERFPARGLPEVCGELLEVARKNRARLARLRRPYLGVRIAVGGLLALGGAAIVALAGTVKLPNILALLQGDSGEALFDLFSGVEAAVNILLLMGVGLFFVLRHEERAKREMALTDLYELRSIAHVIDMHQLSKDPIIVLGRGPRTASSPQETMSAFELSRYLDYCSEMLALVAKCAALYAQDVRDPLVIESVNDLEAMTANLSRKIWQKITIIDQVAPAARAS